MKAVFSLTVLICPAAFLGGQTISPKLQFSNGQTLEITMNVKSKISQQAMGQAIDFNVEGQAIRSYTVTNTTDDNNTLRHKVKRIVYNFDGMGQKRNFDSDRPKDLEGQFGKPIKDLLDKTYDMVIDPAGTVLLVMPETFSPAESDPRMMIITNMLSDVLGAAQPPKKNEASFFKVLPEGEHGVGYQWTVTNENGGKSTTTYQISAITDSTVVIDFTGKSVTVNQSEMMGMQTSTTMNHTTSGQIILDRATGIIKKKTSTTNSTGTTEVMGSSLPVSSSVTTEITVKSLL
jgi:hypothetical protein